MVHRAVFSPEGMRLFSRGYDQTLRIRDVQYGKELANLSLPLRLVYGLYRPTKEVPSPNC